MESLFKLGILLRVMDMVSGPVQAISRSIDGLAAKAEKLQPVFDKFKDYGRWIAGAGIAGALGIGVAVTQFANLEEAQLRLRTTVMDVTGQVGPEYEKLNRLADQLGTALPGSTKDMVQMFTALREQGVQTSQILGGMGEAAAKFAALMKLGFAESAVHVAKFSHSMGLADREIVPFMDLLQRLKYASGVEVGDLAYTFKYAGGSLKLLGLQGLESARDFSAIVGVLARAGIEGSTAGTNLSQAFSRMALIGARLDRGQIKKLVAPILDKYGIDLKFFTQSGEFKGLRPMIQELEKLKALNPQEQIITLQKLFGDEASRPLAVLLQSGVAGYDQMLQKIREQADMQIKITEIMSGAKMQWETMTGTVANLVAHVGGVVARIAGLVGIMKIINDLAGRLDAWVLANPTTAGIIGGVVVAVTSLALAAGGLLLAIGIGGTLVTKMIVGFGLLNSAFGILRIGILAVVGTLSFATLGWTALVVAVVAGFIWMYKHITWFKTLVDGIFFVIGFGLAFIAKGWIELVKLIVKPFMFLFDLLKKVAPAASEAFAGALNAAPDIFKGLAVSGKLIVLGPGTVAPPPGSERSIMADYKTREKAPASRNIRRGPIHIGKIELPNVSNAQDFVSQLQLLVEAHDAN